MAARYLFFPHCGLPILQSQTVCGRRQELSVDGIFSVQRLTGLLPMFKIWFHVRAAVFMRGRLSGSCCGPLYVRMLYVDQAVYYCWRPELLSLERVA